MKKKLTVIALFCVIALQLAAVAGFIGYYAQLEKNILEKGEELRFRVTLNTVDEDGVITFNTDDFYYAYYDAEAQGYLVFDGADGFSYFRASDAGKDILADEADHHIKGKLPNAFPQRMEYASGNTALFAAQSERYWDGGRLREYYTQGKPQNTAQTKQPEAYVTVSLYRGYTAVTGLYIAGEDVRSLGALPEPVPNTDKAENAE